MSRPIRPASSAMHRLKVRVPADIRDRVRGRKIEVPIGVDKQAVTIGEFVEASLRTRDPVEAKARHSAALSAVLRYWTAVREGPKPLTHRQAMALAGMVYRDIVDGNTDEAITQLVRVTETLQDTLDPSKGHPEDTLTAMRRFVDKAGIGIAPLMFSKAEVAKMVPALDWYDLLETVFGSMIDRVLVREGMMVDEDGRRLLLDCVRSAVVDANKDAARKVEGDYSPDPKANRFPPISEAKPNARPKLSVTSLFEGYIKMLKAGGQGAAAEKRWSPVFTKFVTFLKHNDATRVTKKDVIGWKDHRLITEGRSPKTVRDCDLASLKAVFQWAADNLKLPLNPAEGVKVKMPKRAARVREKGFTDGEAKAVLKAALGYQKPEKEYAATAAAKRWTPWLCAFTGARIVEICQLRKEDFHDPEGVPCIRITPDAGSVKSGRYRDVPVHPQLIELGLLRFVQSAKDGPLFYETKARRKGSKTNPAAAVAATMSEWINGLGVIGEGVAPNHGWRHRFKTLAIEVGMNPRAADAIQDHAARTAGEDYGDVTLKAKHTAIRMLPYYRLEEDSGFKAPAGSADGQVP